MGGAGRPWDLQTGPGFQLRHSPAGELQQAARPLWVLMHRSCAWQGFVP